MPIKNKMYAWKEWFLFPIKIIPKPWDHVREGLGARVRDEVLGQIEWEEGAVGSEGFGKTRGAHVTDFVAA